MTPIRSINVLIAALGGEGGGVLTGWIVRAAESLDLPVQSTSIPGVAQRTGTTTYYIEIWPQTRRELAGRQPVLALVPGIGDIDVLLASELMEASRTVAAGFVTPDRTLAIASTSRTYVMDEKTAMADGRYDHARLARAIEDQSQQHLLLDLDDIARQAGALINAVMLGALAGSGALPVPVEAFAAAIRADGKAVESNLRGFGAGLAAAQANVVHAETAVEPGAGAAGDFGRELAEMPNIAREVVRQGLQRLVAYQNIRYARRYLDRLAPITAADIRAKAGGRLLAETARQLALRMSYEDVIRVAHAKIEPQRFVRIAGELGARPDEPFIVRDFLKPGIEELCSILPSFLARLVLRLADRRGWLGHAHWGMQVASTSVSGFLRFWLLAKLRPWRPYTYRFAEEQREIEAWLGWIVKAAALSVDLALEVVACAGLIKGYGDTHKRGSTNYRLIETQVLGPALAGQIPPPQASDAIANARTAALVDPDGESLARCLADIRVSAAQPIAAE